jgi:uncharacterized protein
VESIEVLRRGEITTPWPAREGGDDLQVLYRLGEFQELDVPVLNRGTNEEGQTFRINRWTSALGLQRAQNVTELLLESVADWAVFDMLQAHGIRFRLRAARRAGEHSGREGRAWFVTDAARIRLLDPEVIEVHRSTGVVRDHLTRLPDLLGLTETRLPR